MRAAIRIAGFLGLMLASGLSFAELQLNMSPGVTSFSQGAYEIHQMVMWICVVIGIVVFGAMIYSILNHRKSKGAVPATFHENTTIEIVWTIIPFLILIAMAIPATKVLLAMEDTSNSDMSIKVTGYQWKWHYDYLGEDVNFFSNLTTPREQITGEAEKGEHYLLEVDNKLVIPADKKVRLLFTANDVIHSWWVPAFGLKKDAIPGFINEGWIEVPEPGIYRGKCAELCGKDHGFMPVVVEVKSEEDYVAWLAEQKAEDWRTMIDTNLVGTLYCTHAVLPSMLEKGEGLVINIASVAGIHGLPNEAVYCASKHGVKGFTDALAVELKDKGIRVSGVYPGG